MIKDLVAYIIKQLVNHPKDVHVVVETSDDKALVEINVHEQDRGKVIGRDGHVIKTIRMLVNALTAGEKKVTVDVTR